MEDDEEGDDSQEEEDGGCDDDDGEEEDDDDMDDEEATDEKNLKLMEKQKSQGKVRRCWTCGGDCQDGGISTGCLCKTLFLGRHCQSQ